MGSLDFEEMCMEATFAIRDLLKNPLNDIGNRYPSDGSSDSTRFGTHCAECATH